MITFPHTDSDFHGCSMAVGKLLCHVCCAQCYLGALQELAREAKQVEGFFYNPNIHPLLEFRRRLKAVKVLAEQMKMKVHYEEDYKMQDFLRLVVGHEDERCRICHEARLRRTAKFAKAYGYDAFTTTLLASKHRDHDAVAQLGREVGKEFGMEFFYRDLRPFAERGHDEAKKRNLYLQQYCGCIYSEYERFKDTRRYVYGVDN